MATNRADTLDPALLRPGRLDRKIEFPLPSRREKRLIFHTVTSKMNLGPDVDLEDCQSSLNLRILYGLIDDILDVSRPDRLSSAEITSIVQAAGLQGMHALLNTCLGLNLDAAVRKNRYVILPVDFEEAWKVCYLSIVWSSDITAKFAPFLLQPANGQTGGRHSRVLCVPPTYSIFTVCSYICTILIDR